MLVGTYVASRRRKSGWARARESFPEVARTLGLTHRPPVDSRSIGTLRGEHGGHEVFVDPDDRPRIVVYLKGSPAVVLRTFEHEKRTPPGMAPLPRGLSTADALFADRFASEPLALRLAAHTDELDRTLEPFAVRFRSRVQHLSVTPERIECVLDFGRPLHVPGEAVLALVPAAVSLARLIEGDASPSAAAS